MAAPVKAPPSPGPGRARFIPLADAAAAPVKAPPSPGPGRARFIPLADAAAAPVKAPPSPGPGRARFIPLADAAAAPVKAPPPPPPPPPPLPLPLNKGAANAPAALRIDPSGTLETAQKAVIRLFSDGKIKLSRPYLLSLQLLQRKRVKRSKRRLRMIYRFLSHKGSLPPRQR